MTSAINSNSPKRERERKLSLVLKTWENNEFSVLSDYQYGQASLKQHYDDLDNLEDLEEKEQSTRTDGSVCVVASE